MDDQQPEDSPAVPASCSTAKDFTIEQDAANGFTLTIRCQTWMIGSNEDELTEGDVDLFQRIEDLLNRHAAELLDD